MLKNGTTYWKSQGILSVRKSENYGFSLKVMSLSDYLPFTIRKCVDVFWIFILHVLSDIHERVLLFGAHAYYGSPEHDGATVCHVLRMPTVPHAVQYQGRHPRPHAQRVTQVLHLRLQGWVHVGSAGMSSSFESGVPSRPVEGNLGGPDQI